MEISDLLLLKLSVKYFKYGDHHPKARYKSVIFKNNLD